MVVKRLRKEDRRVQLLEVARGIVRQQGTEALTLGYLAERACVTKPIPYDHFGDREGLLMALYQDFSDTQLKKFRATLAVDNKTLENTIRFFSAAYIDCAISAGPETGPIAAALSGSRALLAFRETCVADCANCLRSALAPYVVLKGVRGEAALTAIIGAADALSSAASSGALARHVAEDMLSGAMSGVLEVYADNTK
ncbi:TetR/AcrR family transcriptional regulator [Shimwellia pseudoproteus]|uniref:TetR/AcrR family transcriptional regulator n=1 Tax=Shimwellia pseudoproteus TaxID=570012 RepID=UPI0018ECA41D|nr:TetR/AcrR family transcriptional regulator [Shimwellia pseudoproteus]MBJ3814708.1 TetR/AcrR family transcriptional regulator [Shimwellia pseudoproteus]